MAEFDLIDLIRTRCAIMRDDVRLGIGDDAALLAVPPGWQLAVSADTLVAGVHFPAATAPFDVGWKSLAVNLSDLAAMGATPAWALLALTLPHGDVRWVAEFADGFAALAREYKLALVGGDTTQGPLSITVTIHGFVPEGGALLRSGARVGDAVYVTGTLGDAAGGLRGLDRADAAPLVERLNRPTPRVAQGLLLRGRAHACIDVSDGLAADLGHIARASGVGALIDADSLPASPALLARFDTDARRALQLAGGDDYELCFTAPEEAGDLLDDLARSGCAATKIGRIVAEPGVRVVAGDGSPVAIPRAGWEHFA
ncbi:MAG TPA: thiamine-phosphate kinase [Rudaea sp.]